MATDWDEIKRLAADFQKVQLSSTSQKLSERNCIEIVTLLIEKGLIDVIFTNDGKEYLTSGHLETEILDELFMRGGRVNLVELSKALNVDLSKIEVIAENVSKSNGSIYFLLGQLINESYIQRIASEINERLTQNGEISVSDLTVQFDLPSDFILVNIMEKYLGTIIHGRQDSKDSRFFFTQTFIARCRAKLRGALAAITRPTPVSAILAQCGVKERLFHSLLDEVCTAGTITSKSPGAQYIPHLYTKTQVDWINNIWRREGYLEHDSVIELGVSDPKSFIQQQLPKEKLTHLKKCTIGSRIVEQLESELDEAISTAKFLDVSTVLPSVMNDDDIEQLLEIILTPAKLKTILRFGNKVVTNEYLDEVIKPCHEIIAVNAKSAVDAGKYQQFVAERQMASNRNQDTDFGGDGKGDKREERRKKAASGKVGGGTQGRETKTKSTKKHFRGGGKRGDSDSDDDQHELVGKSKSTAGLEIISVKDIVKCIQPTLEKDDLDDLAKSIAHHFYAQLSKVALAKAQTLFEATLQNNNQSRRQTHAALQEKLNMLLGDIRLYERGLKLLPPDIQTQLIKYMLKSLGVDICNELFLYVANESSLPYNESQLTIEQRNKIVQDCAPEYKTALNALNKTVNGSSVEEFLLAAETALQVCSMILKKVDKKKDRVLIHSHKLGLIEQLSKSDDPALVLHLAVLIIFTTATQNMIHASGRHVSGILTFLNPMLADDQTKTLRDYHDLVLKVLVFGANASGDDTGEENGNSLKEASEQLNKLIPVVKEMAKAYKKTGTTNVE